jgi:hypothetical protein
MESPDYIKLLEQRYDRERKRLLVMHIAEIAKYTWRDCWHMVHRRTPMQRIMGSVSHVALVTRYGMVQPISVVVEADTPFVVGVDFAKSDSVSVAHHV